MQSIKSQPRVVFYFLIWNEALPINNKAMEIDRRKCLAIIRDIEPKTLGELFIVRNIMKLKSVGL
jgi:hypothetical protein